MYKIFSNYRRVFIQRNNQTTEVTNGDMITAEEFTTMSSEGNVECVDQDTNTLVIYATDDIKAPVSEPAAVVIENTPATDAGVVPASVDTGKKVSKA